MSEETKTETAICRLSKSLRKRFQGASVHIPWVELDAFLMKAQTTELNNILKAYNDGYSDASNGKPNRANDETNESNTNV
jgi:hypothetical protein